jgi:hypothetical protein
MTDLKTRSVLNRKFGKFQKRIEGVYGFMGDGSGNVNASRQPYVYVRLPDNTVVEVYNKRIQPKDGVPVLCGYDPLEPFLFQVLSLWTTALNSPEAISPPYMMPKHGWRHQWGIGDDVVFVEKRQYMPARVGASAAGGLQVDIYQDIIYINGGWTVLTSQTVDMASYQPSTSGKSKIVLLSYSITGTITKTASAELTFNSELITDVPAIPSGEIALAAVRLYTGQTSIRDGYVNRDIMDCRTWISPTPKSGNTMAQYSAISVSNPPTQSEINAAFGDPSVAGAGYIGFINNNGTSTNNYLTMSDGEFWWFSSLTKSYVSPDTNLSVLDFDTFTGSDGAHLNIHTMNTGSGWTENTGSWIIEQNTAQQETGTTGYYVMTTDAGKSDLKIHARVKALAASGNKYGGVIVRYTDANNYWMIFVEWAAGTVGIAEMVGGTPITRATKSWPKRYQKFVEVDVTCNGDNISATFDGGYGATYNSSANNTSTLFGVFEYRDGTYTYCAFDDFQIIDLPAYPWTRQGTVISAGTGDSSNVYEPTVIYESSAQILSGTVFKMWYTGGWATRHINYAESTDGINWTKYTGNPVITGASRSTVLRVGSTYYLYGANDADTEINQYTSSDGINWTLANSGVILRGSGGEWDAANLSNSFVWYEGTNNWKILYDAEAADGHQRTGYATSVDGVAWTKSGSNPVMDWGYVVGGPTVIKVGSYYYAFMIMTSDGDSPLPSYISRWRSANLTAWEQYPFALEVPRIGSGEGEDNTVGQTADPSILIDGSTAYLYFAASSDGSSSSGAQHIVLATADSRAIDRY